MKNKGVVHGEHLKMFYEGTPNLENFKQFRAEQTDKIILGTQTHTEKGSQFHPRLPSPCSLISSYSLIHS